MMEGEAPLQEEAAELARHVRRVPSSTRVAVVANILAACDGLELTFLKLHLEDILARHPSAKQFQVCIGKRAPVCVRDLSHLCRTTNLRPILPA